MREVKTIRALSEKALCREKSHKMKLHNHINSLLKEELQDILILLGENTQHQFRILSSIPNRKRLLILQRSITNLQVNLKVATST